MKKQRYVLLFLGIDQDLVYMCESTLVLTGQIKEFHKISKYMLIVSYHMLPPGYFVQVQYITRSCIYICRVIKMKAVILSQKIETNVTNYQCYCFRISSNAKGDIMKNHQF